MDIRTYRMKARMSKKESLQSPMPSTPRPRSRAAKAKPTGPPGGSERQTRSRSMSISSTDNDVPGPRNLPLTKPEQSHQWSQRKNELQAQQPSQTDVVKGVKKSSEMISPSPEPPPIRKYGEVGEPQTSHEKDESMDTGEPQKVMDERSARTQLNFDSLRNLVFLQKSSIKSSEAEESSGYVSRDESHVTLRSRGQAHTDSDSSQSTWPSFPTPYSECVVCKQKFKSKGCYYTSTFPVRKMKEVFCKAFKAFENDVAFSNSKYPFCTDCCLLITDLCRREHQVQMSLHNYFEGMRPLEAKMAIGPPVPSSSVSDLDTTISDSFLSDGEASVQENIAETIPPETLSNDLALMDHIVEVNSIKPTTEQKNPLDSVQKPSFGPISDNAEDIFQEKSSVDMALTLSGKGAKNEHLADQTLKDSKDNDHEKEEVFKDNNCNLEISTVEQTLNPIDEGSNLVLGETADLNSKNKKFKVTDQILNSTPSVNEHLDVSQDKDFNTENSSNQLRMTKKSALDPMDESNLILNETSVISDLHCPHKKKKKKSKKVTDEILNPSSIANDNEQRNVTRGQDFGTEKISSNEQSVIQSTLDAADESTLILGETANPISDLNSPYKKKKMKKKNKVTDEILNSSIVNDNQDLVQSNDFGSQTMTEKSTLDPADEINPSLNETANTDLNGPYKKKKKKKTKVAEGTLSFSQRDNQQLDVSQDNDVGEKVSFNELTTTEISTMDPVDKSDVIFKEAADLTLDNSYVAKTTKKKKKKKYVTKEINYSSSPDEISDVIPENGCDLEIGPKKSKKRKHKLEPNPMLDITASMTQGDSCSYTTKTPKKKKKRKSKADKNIELTPIVDEVTNATPENQDCSVDTSFIKKSKKKSKANLESFRGPDLPPSGMFKGELNQSSSSERSSKAKKGEKKFCQLNDSDKKVPGLATSSATNSPLKKVVVRIARSNEVELAVQKLVQSSAKSAPDNTKPRCSNSLTREKAPPKKRKLNLPVVPPPSRSHLDSDSDDEPPPLKKPIFQMLEPVMSRSNVGANLMKNKWTEKMKMIKSEPFF